jgi:hypothetical protein
MSKKPHSKNPAWYNKGKTGNPGGRPRKSQAPQHSTFDIVMDKTFFETRDGIAREIGLEEALRLRIYQDALAGKIMAMREVGKWMVKREAWLNKHEPKTFRSAITQHISPDPDNADAALLLLGIAAIYMGRSEFGNERLQLLLEPWAVHEALRRRRGGQRLTEVERYWIRRCTRDAESLRWPRGTDE